MLMAKSAKCIFFPKDKELFKLGDPADNFYIIYSGEIKRHKLGKRKKNLTQSEYIVHLKNLKDNNDKYILQKTLSFNRGLDINEYEIDRIYEKMRKINDIKHEVNLRVHTKLFMANKYNYDYEKFVVDIENGDMPENLNNADLKNKLYENSFANSIDIMDDERILDVNLYNLYIFHYIHDKTFSVKNFFGENGDTKNRRKHFNYYIPAVDSICLMISNSNYKKLIKVEYEKMRNREIKFLNSNFIFKEIVRSVFLANYIKYFQRKEFHRDAILFQEEDRLDNIYFIKEGSLELSLNCDIICISDFIKRIIYSNKEITKIFSDNNNFPQIKNQPKDFIEQLKSKNSFSIMLIKDNDILGLEEFFFDFNRLYTATVKSENAIIYSIPIKKINKIFSLEPKVQKNFEEFSQTKIKSFLERVIKIKNDHIEFHDKKFSGENKKVKLKITMSNINKSLLKFKENELDAIAEYKKYFDEFNDLSIPLKKKYNLLSTNNEEYLFYNDWNNENFAIKNIKKEIEKMQKTSLSKFLPDINSNNNKSRRNINTKSISFNTLHYSPQRNKILNKCSNDSTFINENSFNALETDKLNSTNNNNTNDKEINNNVNTGIDTKLNILQRLSQMEDFKKFEKNSVTFITNKNEKNADINANANEMKISKININESNVNNVPDSILNEYEVLNTEQMIQQKEKFVTLKKQRNPFVFENSNFTRFTHLENDETKNYSNLNMNNLSTKTSNLTIGFKNSQISQKINRSTKNQFKPFKVDNSIKTIKDKDKTLQMSMARKMYRFKSFDLI